MKKRLATTVCALGLLLSAGIASAGTSPISYAKNCLLFLLILI